MRRRSTTKEMEPLSAFVRFYIYGLHGWGVEVVFCAIWFFITDYNLKLHGYSSIWSFPIYGGCLMTLEKMKHFFDERCLGLLLRLPVYLVWAYAWELICGLLLYQFDAHSWDYSSYSTYHLWGLINFEYAPFWLGSLLLAELFLFPSVHRLHTVRE